MPGNSFCGYTVQYGGLEKLHREFAPRGFACLGRSGKVPRWNSGKYLVGKDGQVVDLFHSDVTPESATLRGAIEKALVAPIPAGGSR